MKQTTCIAVPGRAVSTPVFPSAKRLLFCLLSLLLLVAVLGGCAPKGSNSSVALDGQNILSETEKDEVIIDLPYPPADDGLPLTREEAIAFSYTSDFIAPLNEREQQEEVLLYFKYFITWIPWAGFTIRWEWQWRQRPTCGVPWKRHPETRL